jgi:hypothetical protein
MAAGKVKNGRQTRKMATGQKYMAAGWDKLASGQEAMAAGQKKMAAGRALRSQNQSFGQNTGHPAKKKHNTSTYMEKE